jgi:hypothetical protein
MSAIAIDLMAQKYGWVAGLSTAAASRVAKGQAKRKPKESQEEVVAKFMILPEFRVAKAARLGECPPAQLAPA